ncbi:MAG: biotin/lipoate A/B protein ligase family protein [Pirellulaceae bacterium]
MKLLDLTLDQVSGNLALDEALLEMAESAAAPLEIFRIWESPQLAAVVGRSSKVRNEVNLEVCSQREIPVLRRCSGGASVLIGPGCLMYAVVLSYERRPGLRSIEEAHRFVLGRIAAAVAPLVSAEVKLLGTSDLAIRDCKFSGNSLRCRRTHLLYHGTVLYGFPIALIDRCLLTPPRQPEYRAGRAHGQFVANVSVPVDTLRRALIDAWPSPDELIDWPREYTQKLVSQRYGNDEWNLSR